MSHSQSRFSFLFTLCPRSAHSDRQRKLEWKNDDFQWKKNRNMIRVKMRQKKKQQTTEREKEEERAKQTEVNCVFFK